MKIFVTWRLCTLNSGGFLICILLCLVLFNMGCRKNTVDDKRGKTVNMLRSLAVAIECYTYENGMEGNNDFLAKMSPYEIAVTLSTDNKYMPATALDDRLVSGVLTDFWGREVLLFRYARGVGVFAVGSRGGDGVWQNGAGDDIVEYVHYLTLNLTTYPCGSVVHGNNPIRAESQPKTDGNEGQKK